MTPQRLIVFAGRPGTGKTTLARMLARDLGAVYLRIDSIEDGIRKSHLAPQDLMDAGYTVAQAVANDALKTSQTVVADAVHGHQQGRDDWEALAKAHELTVTWIHVVCSDEAEHKARIRARADAGERYGADWLEVSTREFASASPQWIEIDTSGQRVDTSRAQIMRHIDQCDQ